MGCSILQSGWLMSTVCICTLFAKTIPVCHPKYPINPTLTVDGSNPQTCTLIPKVEDLNPRTRIPARTAKDLDPHKCIQANKASDEGTYGSKTYFVHSIGSSEPYFSGYNPQDSRYAHGHPGPSYASHTAAHDLNTMEMVTPFSGSSSHSLSSGLILIDVN